MDNNKLGLKIVRINEGYQEVLVINDNQLWTKKTWDIREDLKNIDNINDSSVILMLTCIEDGHILTLVHPTEGRLGDCICAWIYIPASINITGKELLDIVDISKKELLADAYNEENFQKNFSKTYKETTAKRITEKSKGEKCAYRYYGQGVKYQLHELLNDRFQTYYKSYKSIFLLDKSSKLTCTLKDDLTNEKLVSMVLVKSPGEVDFFTPYIGEVKFEGQMYYTEGDALKIEWKRKGYLSITTQDIIKPGIHYSTPSSDKYIKLFPYSFIEVVDESGDAINDYQLQVDDKTINKGAEIQVKENALKNVQVRIKAEEYEPYKQNKDFSKPPIRVTLKRIKRTYNFRFPSKDGKEEGVIMQLTTNQSINACPIKGYTLKHNSIYEGDNNNQLKYKPFSRKFWIICFISIFITLILGFCCGYVVSYYTAEKMNRNQINTLYQTNIDTKKTTNNTYNQNSSTDPSLQNSDTIHEAISYLDNNNVWNRTEMEKFDVLEGLWDAMNERRFDDILKYENKLRDSEKFKDVLKAIRENKSKRFSGNFNSSPNDYDITIEQQGNYKGYIKSLYDAQNPNNKKTPKKQSPSEQKDW